MKKFLKNTRIDNTWSVIKISELPDDMPCLGITEYPSKSMAEFHLVEYCLIPKSVKDKNKTVQSQQ